MSSMEENGFLPQFYYFYLEGNSSILDSLGDIDQMMDETKVSD